MAPRGKAKLHQLASLLPEKTIISDTRKQRFVIEKEFAKGGFGRIYSGHQEDSTEFGNIGSLAIKVEPQANGPLFTEIYVFQRILRLNSLREWMKMKKLKHLGLPPHLSSGIFTHKGEKLRFLVMPKYGRSLESYRSGMGGSMNTIDALTVARQCSDCLDYIQEQEYVHSDIKADNILLSASNSLAECYLVDFGLARMAKTNVEKADKKRAHNGTALFTSLDAHRGFMPSWRGDLEILAYNILYWISGSLPWQSVESQLEKVLAAKEHFSKSYENEVLSIVPNACGKYLVKLFAIAYETPYKNKINYNQVNEILDAAIKSCSSKSSLPSTPRRKSTTDSAKKSAVGRNLGPTSVASSSRPVVGATTTALTASLPVRKTPVVRKVKAVPKVRKTRKSPVNSSDLTTAASLKHSSVIPGLANWKSPRDAAKVGEISSSIMPSSSKIKRTRHQDGEDTVDVPAKKPTPDNSEEGEEIRLEDGCEDGALTNQKQAVKMAVAKVERPLRNRTRHQSPLHIVPSGRSPEMVDQSAIASLIPGVRNMKKIRRSLGAAVLKKYVGLANKRCPHNIKSPEH